MKTALPILLVLAACSGGGDPMPYLSATQRACLSQVKTAVNLKPGEAASLFVSREGVFTGAVTQDGFTRYELSAKPYDDCIAQAGKAQAVAVRNQVAPGIVLSDEDKALWDSLTPAQQERALTFLRNGGTIQSSLQEN